MQYAKELRPTIVPACALLVVLLLLIGSAGCLGGHSQKKAKPPLDSDGDGVPDAQDKYPNRANWAFNISYLDDTQTNPGQYKVTISSTTDYGVILVNNTGVDQDTIDMTVVAAPEGWMVSLDQPSVTLDNKTVVCVVVTYTVPSGASGEKAVVIQGRSAKAARPLIHNLTLICNVETTSGKVTNTGDKVVVGYILWDTSGNQLDSGTLPATAGEKYVGPAQQLGYIVGFYMGLIGMKKPGILGIIGNGEVKKIRVPPELAYGTDPNAHQLGGQTLIFQLSLMSG